MRAVRKVVDSLGGMTAFVTEGERILLKPNMLIPRKPEEAVTTHPEVLRAVIKLVKEAGASPIVGDSPAGRSTERILKHLADRTGVASVCNDEGVAFVLFTEGKSVSFPEGRVAKSFDLTTVLDDVDGVISIAKLKTHSYTRFTGAVKNVFGLVYGLKKAEYHMRMKRAESFSEMLVDLAECVRPRLTVMDAVVGMDGDGPSAGRPKDIGLILASSNTHALDMVALSILGEEPENVHTIRTAIDRGFLPADGLGGIKVVYDRPEGYHISGFRMPPKGRMFRPILSLFGGFVAEGIARKPVFLKETCTRCGSCVEICPAEALSVNEEVVIKRSQCIRCYCCQEVCPQNAVVLRRMPFRSWGRSLGSRLKRMRESEPSD
jgi:uncharacterized protein (DUF362 family)/NAD-dependent dihydropyrimidine dehydrogenase PreA subunit